jgi:hypothetical protein
MGMASFHCQLNLAYELHSNALVLQLLPRYVGHLHLLSYQKQRRCEVEGTRAGSAEYHFTSRPACPLTERCSQNLWTAVHDTYVCSEG